MSFLGEFKRRKIIQVAAIYAVEAWLLIQIVATVENPLSANLITKEHFGSLDFGVLLRQRVYL